MNKRISRRVLLIGLSTMIALVAMGPVAWAQGIVTANPDLPPDKGKYLSAADVHAEYHGPSLDVILQRPEHKPIADRALRTAVGPDEHEEFDSIFSADAEVDYMGSGPIKILGVELTGPVQVITQGKTGNVTGTFATEIVSMNLTGNIGGIPVIVQESPSLPSSGQTTITDLGGGLYHIDSFFDVFTELSVDGGNSWIPSTGGTRMTLTPEPSTFVLAAIGLLGLLGWGWRRRRRI